MQAKQWFEDLVGFTEQTPEQVRSNIVIEDECMESLVNRRRFRHGKLDTPSLAQLRAESDALNQASGAITFREVVDDVRGLHVQPGSSGALFQVASQFNLLEMTSPHVTPEAGVAIYGLGPTQGPACAVACGAGTIFRNYFVPVGDDVGQTEDRQINCVKEFGDMLGNADGSLWTMSNGYALGKEDGLAAVGNKTRAMSESELDHVRQKLRIGVQYNTEVTIGSGRPVNVVTQAYCSAFPVGYSEVRKETWEPVARLLLEASYEATLRAAVINANNGGSNMVFLTLVGGGVFGNEMSWILDAIERALQVMEGSGLDVRLVSYRCSRPEVRALER